jgi:hypothetical protein
MAMAIGFSAAALVLFATSAQANQLVLNGSFANNTGYGQLGYNTSASGWTVANGGYTFLFSSSNYDTTGVNGQYGNLALWGPNSGSNNGFTAPPGGGNFIGMDSTFQVQPIQQTISGLTAGQTYVLNFDWATAQQTGFTGGTFDNWEVCLGTECFSTASEANPSKGFSGWYGQTFTYTATGGSEVLSFLAQGSDCCGNTNSEPPFILLDDVSLTNTPEPGTFSLLFTGMIGGIAVLRAKMRLKRQQ